MDGNNKLYKRVVPYLVAGGIAFGTGSLLGYTPFHSDKDVVEQEYMKEIFPDNHVEITYIDDNYNTDDFIKSYSKWEMQDDGEYQREVNYYFFNNYSEETLREAVKKTKYIEPSLTTVETSPTLTDEELENNKAYSTIVVFDEKKKTVRESILTNTLSTCVEVAIFLLLVFGTNELEERRVRMK